MRTVRALTTSQRRELEAELLTERMRLERSIQAQAAAERVESGDAEASYDVSSLNGGLGIGLETRTTARLEAVRAALARLEEGTYGICSGCRSPIPFGRLIVMPESTLCVACGRA